MSKMLMDFVVYRLKFMLRRQMIIVDVLRVCWESDPKKCPFFMRLFKTLTQFLPLDNIPWRMVTMIQSRYHPAL